MSKPDNTYIIDIYNSLREEMIYYMKERDRAIDFAIIFTGSILSIAVTFDVTNNVLFLLPIFVYFPLYLRHLQKDFQAKKVASFLKHKVEPLIPAKSIRWEEQQTIIHYPRIASLRSASLFRFYPFMVYVLIVSCSIFTLSVSSSKELQQNTPYKVNATLRTDDSISNSVNYNMIGTIHNDKESHILPHADNFFKNFWRSNPVISSIVIGIIFINIVLMCIAGRLKIIPHFDKEWNK